MLLSPTVPPPMHGLAPRAVLGREWWNAVRFAAQKATDYHCIACGVRRGAEEWSKHLDGHEVYEVDWLLGRMTYVETVPLCRRCHQFCHPGYLAVLVDEGVVTPAERGAILEHGRMVLEGAGLAMPTRGCTGPTVEWNEWRMVVGGVEYPPLRTREEHAEHYKR